MFKIEFTKQGLEDIRKLQKNEISAFKKVSALIEELKEHPRSGTGHPEQLKEYGNETWSRRITKKTPLGI